MPLFKRILCAATMVLFAQNVGAEAAKAESEAPPAVEEAAKASEPVPDKSRTTPVIGHGVVNFDDVLSYANMEVTVASKVKEKMNEAAAVVTALPRPYIDDYRWRSINDVLIHQPGFSLSRDFERDTISMRGIFQAYTNNRILLLLDGVQQNDATNGSAFTWEIVPLFMTKKLEVVRGPGSALYGTNAMQGVVAMNTVDANDLPSLGAARLQWGTRSTQIYDAVAGAKGKYFSGVVGANFYLTNGNEYPSYDMSGRTNPDTGRLQQFLIRDHRDSRYLFAKLDGEGVLKGLRLEFQDNSWFTNTTQGWFFVIPDHEGPMNYSRKTLSLQYRATVSDFHHEYILAYGRTTRDWFPRFYPNNVAGYTSGEFEYLNNYVDDLFGRAQITYDLGEGATVLGGVELQNMFYDGDVQHYANVNMSGDEPQNPNGEFDTLGPHYGPIQNKPFLRTGVFAQGASGKLLGDMFAVTLGLRYDNTYLQYAAPDGTVRSRSIDQLSPRLALVLTPGSGFVVKAMGSHAFRAPALTELSSSNSNIDTGNLNIRPETVTTFELTGEWDISEHALAKVNLYDAQFNEAIAFSPEDNTHANMYSANTGGVEAEINLRFNPITVYANYSYARRYGETSDDPNSIMASNHTVTWVPYHLANIGVNYKADKFNAMLQSHFQGPTKRRNSDLTNAQYNQYRPDEVQAWATLDAALAYHATEFLQLEVRGTNLLDSGGHMIAIHPRPFDYRIEGRRVFASAMLSY